MISRLRPARAADAEAISQLVSALTARHIAHAFSERARERLLSSMTPAAVRSYLLLDYRFTLAEVGAELAGVVAVKLPSHLFYLFVAEAHQQRGLARKLWDHARRTTPAIVWTVNAATAARPVYERLGFTTRGPIDRRGGIESLPMMWPDPGR
ncbi:MAG TPA: GNAT family N-acetyltransferase [Polyangiales bacterium]|nr:GNAT family N-acetyltransferase [Polyangiales bacterium]